MTHEERARWALIEGQRRYIEQRGRKLMGEHQIDVIAETLAAVEREAYQDGWDDAMKKKVAVLRAAVERETLERAALMCESLAAQSHTLGEYANEGQRLHCAAAIRALTDQKETA